MYSFFFFKQKTAYEMLISDWSSDVCSADLRFGMPIDCTIGEDCYLQQYVDHDPGGGYRDYRCGPLSYDGHKGTDFRLKDVPIMERGVRVLAAAPGTVVATRDGLPDVNVKLIGADIVRDQGLGKIGRAHV